VKHAKRQRQAEAPQPRQEQHPAAAPKAIGWHPARPVLVASNARQLLVDTGTYCAACPRLLRRGERVAQLPDGRLVHVACAAQI
jgi:hypothetical protein